MTSNGEGDSARPSALAALASLSLLPLSAALLFLHLLRSSITSAVDVVFRSLNRSASSSRKVLITGASSPSGLSTARLLSASGHTVIAADFEAVPYTSCARASAATSRFYALSGHGSLLAGGVNAAEAGLFSTNVLFIAQHEKPDLWIPCARLPDAEVVAAAKEIVEKECSTRVLHPDAATLRLLTDEVAFAKFVNSLDAGLAAPEVRAVFTRGEIHKALGSWPMKRRFMLQKLDPVSAAEVQVNGADSSTLSRRHSRPVSFASTGSTLTAQSFESERGEVVEEYEGLAALMLPSGSASDTYDRVASIRISKSEPWMLQEMVHGEQYTAHCFVVRNELSAFALTALSKASWPTVLPSASGGRSAMHERILEFMQTLVRRLPKGTSTHLNVRFVLSETSTQKGVSQMLYPVSADVEACGTTFLHGSCLVSHSSWSKMARELSSRYEGAMLPAANGEVRGGERNAIQNGSGAQRNNNILTVTTPALRSDSDLFVHTGTYSLPLSIWHLLILPLLHLLLLQESLGEVARSGAELVNRLVYDKEELFEWRDPWPWIWTWCVGMPLRNLVALGWARSGGGSGRQTHAR